MIRDLHSNVRTKTAIIAAAIGANATKTGPVIDRQGYGGVEFLLSYGSVTTTGTDVAVVIKDGDVTGTMASVANDYLLGTEVLAALPAATPRTAGTTKEVTKRIGYVGVKRYVQCLLVQTGVTSVGCVSAVALLHNPALGNQTNP